MATKKRRPQPPRSLSDQLKGIIKRRGLTAYAIAQAAELDASVVSRFLADERGLTTQSLDRIADALGLELRETRRGLTR